ncbi:MAG: flagellar biosynthetic protein FliR, partial [Betaproteobacteria bacterium]
LSRPDLNQLASTKPGPIQLSPDHVAAFLLLATRFGALLLMSPPIGGGAVPATVRVAVVVALAVCFSSLVPAPAQGWSLWQVVAALAGEVVLGLTMAVGLNLAFAAFAIGARILDTQIGFGIGQVFNPLTRQQTPILTGLFAQVALVLFFTTDAPDGVLRGVVLSIQAYPPGTAWPLQSALGPVIAQVAGLFALGFAIVAPVVFCLLLVELGLGVISRSLPQMNMFAMGIPIKIVVGLTALAIWTTGSLALLLRTHAAVFKGWEAMFR